MSIYSRITGTGSYLPPRRVTNDELAAELASFKEENETLQLSALEQDDQQSTTLARIQALVALVSGESSQGPVNS